MVMDFTLRRDFLSDLSYYLFAYRENYFLSSGGGGGSLNYLEYLFPNINSFIYFYGVFILSCILLLSLSYSGNS
jgi:hypothetical protein